MISNNNKLPDTTEVENEDGSITRTSFKYKGKEIIKTYTKYKLVKSSDNCFLFEWDKRIISFVYNTET